MKRDKLLHEEGVFGPWFLVTFQDIFMALAELANAVQAMADVDQTARWRHG